MSDSDHGEMSPAQRSYVPPPPGPIYPDQSHQPDWQTAQTPPQYGPPVSPAGPLDPLIGAAKPNQAYLGNRLTYSDHPTDFDPLVNPEYLRTLASRFAATVVVWFGGMFILFLVFGIAGIRAAIPDETSFFEDSGGSTGLLYFWYVLNCLYSLFLAIAFWFTPLQVQLSEWMVTIDGKGARASAVLDHMYAIIQARRLPVRQLDVIRMAPPHQATRDYLRLVDGSYLGFVSSFAYGSDLFVGWTFWINMSPIQWIGRILRRMFTSLGRHDAATYSGLVIDQPKAMREVMHSAVRQGVDVATGETPAAGQGTIGFAVPVVPLQI